MTSSYCKCDHYEEKIISIKIADEDVDGGFLLLTPKGAGSVNGSGESINFDTDSLPL